MTECMGYMHGYEPDYNGLIHSYISTRRSYFFSKNYYIGAAESSRELFWSPAVIPQSAHPFVLFFHILSPQNTLWLISVKLYINMYLWSSIKFVQMKCQIFFSMVKDSEIVMQNDIPYDILAKFNQSWHRVSLGKII